MKNEFFNSLVDLVKENTLYFCGEIQELTQSDAEIIACNFINAYADGQTFYWKKTPTAWVEDEAEYLTRMYLGKEVA